MKMRWYVLGHVVSLVTALAVGSANAAGVAAEGGEEVFYTVSVSRTPY